jgi:hypothetical protein
MAGAWTVVEAGKWWDANAGSLVAAPGATMVEKTLVIAPRAVVRT